MKTYTIYTTIIATILSIYSAGCCCCPSTSSKTYKAEEQRGAASASSSKSSASNSANPTEAKPVEPAAPANSDLPSEPAKPDVVVTNTVLWNDYQANEVSADQKYKGKTLQVSGVVSSIDKDFLGNIVVHLRSPNEFMETMASLENESVAAKLKKGQNVVFICIGDGLVVGSPSLDDCVVK